MIIDQTSSASGLPKLLADLARASGQVSPLLLLGQFLSAIYDWAIGSNEIIGDFTICAVRIILSDLKNQAWNCGGPTRGECP